MAADPLFVPLGAPVFIDLDRNEADGLWVAQDTGGAIKGANRFDTFWGAGSEAERIAGGMSASGTALILLPKGSVARIEAARAAAAHGVELLPLSTLAHHPIPSGLVLGYAGLDVADIARGVERLARALVPLVPPTIPR